jgi:hypothetical protein
MGTLETLAVGMNGTPQPLGPSNQVAYAWMWPTTAGMPATDLIFADIAGDPFSGGPASSTEIFGIDGSVRQALLLNSEFLPNATSPQSGVVLERVDIDSYNFEGTVQAMTLSTLATTPLYSVGTQCCGFGLSGLSSGVVAGEMQPYAPNDSQAVLINLKSGGVAVFGNGNELATLF